MSGEVDNGSSCPLAVYDSPAYRGVAIVRVLTGLVSFCCCLVLLSFFLYTKKHLLVMNEKLVFYLVIAAMLHSFSYLIGRVNFYSPRPIVDRYCLFAGPLELYAGWTEFMCILCISYNLLAQVTFEPKNKHLHWLYFSLIFGLPLLWCWLPFINYTFGTHGPWCGIRIFDENCEIFVYGVVLRSILVEFPKVLLFTVTILFSLATWILLKRKMNKRKTEAYPQSRPVDKSQLLAELKLLLWYPPVYTVLQVLLLVSLVYENAEPSSSLQALWYLQALTSPLVGAAIALVIVLSSEWNILARVRAWLTRLIRQPVKENGQPPSRCVSEYECQLHVSYGDSVEGVQNQRQQERLRNSPIEVTTV